MQHFSLVFLLLQLLKLKSVQKKHEYMTDSKATCEVIWMMKILIGLFGQQMDPTVIYYANHSFKKLSVNPVFHDSSKHIDIRYHHLKDCV